MFTTLIYSWIAPDSWAERAICLLSGGGGQGIKTGLEVEDQELVLYVGDPSLRTSISFWDKLHFLVWAFFSMGTVLQYQLWWKPHWKARGHLQLWELSWGCPGEGGSQRGSAHTLHNTAMCAASSLLQVTETVPHSLILPLALTINKQVLVCPLTNRY